MHTFYWSILVAVATAMPLEPPQTRITAKKGKVTAVTEKTITLQSLPDMTGEGYDVRVRDFGRISLGYRTRPGDVLIEVKGQAYRGKIAVNTKEVLMLFSTDGKLVLTVRRAEEKPVKYAASVELLTCQGEYLPDRTLPVLFGYRPSDIRVGDEVNLRIRTRNNGDPPDVVGAQIVRRPGGQVPPCPFLLGIPGNENHEMENAEQAYEEKGIRPPGWKKYQKERERLPRAFFAPILKLPANASYDLFWDKLYQLAKNEAKSLQN